MSLPWKIWKYEGIAPWTVWFVLKIKLKVGNNTGRNLFDDKPYFRFLGPFLPPYPLLWLHAVKGGGELAYLVYLTLHIYLFSNLYLWMTVNSKVGKYLEVDSAATPTLEIHKEWENIHILYLIIIFS